MTKPLSYREVTYSITKGPSTQNRFSTRPHWHGVITFADKTSEEMLNRKTKVDLIAGIKREINIHLDYDGDSELYFTVENLVRDVAGRGRWFPSMGPRRLTVSQLRSRIARACEIAQRIVETRVDESGYGELATKLRAMTVANGCTVEEAATAQEKLRRLLEAKP